MNPIEEILGRIESDTTYKKMTPKEYEQFVVDGLNDTEGNRHEWDGYQCDACKNKGYVVKLIERENGTYTNAATDCRCLPIRRSIMRMKRSGLQNVIKDYTFDKFQTTEGWQQTLKDAAMKYAKNPEGWFFIGGQTGCGKTHLCTAICRELLLSGKSVLYMLWRDEIVKIKAAVNDNEEYHNIISQYKTVDVLYIDDLFKTGKSKDGDIQKPTIADINAAFEIINYRYNNPDLITIISSELTEDELLDIDEAIGGRIYERSKAISIGRNRERNYRIKNAITI